MLFNVHLPLCGHFLKCSFKQMYDPSHSAIVCSSYNFDSVLCGFQWICWCHFYYILFWYTEIDKNQQNSNIVFYVGLTKWLIVSEEHFTQINPVIGLQSCFCIIPSHIEFSKIKFNYNICIKPFNVVLLAYLPRLSYMNHHVSPCSYRAAYFFIMPGKFLSSIGWSWLCCGPPLIGIHMKKTLKTLLKLNILL